MEVDHVFVQRDNLSVKIPVENRKISMVNINRWVYK